MKRWKIVISNYWIPYHITVNHWSTRYLIAVIEIINEKNGHIYYSAVGCIFYLPSLLYEFVCVTWKEIKHEWETIHEYSSREYCTQIQMPWILEFSLNKNFLEKLQIPHEVHFIFTGSCNFMMAFIVRSVSIIFSLALASGS